MQACSEQNRNEVEQESVRLTENQSGSAAKQRNWSRALPETKTVPNEAAEVAGETKVKPTLIRERQRDLANEITMKLKEITFGRQKTELKRSQTRELEGSIGRDENKFE